MSRNSGLWQRKENRFWYTTLNGKQVKLSQDKGEARKLLHKLLADDRPAQGVGFSCRKLLDTYLVKTAPDKSEKRVRLQADYFKKFCEAFGHRRAESLKPFEVNDWVDSLAVSDSTKAQVVAMLKAGFAWGKREGYYPLSPLAAVRYRKVARRERMLSQQEVDKVIAASRPRWQEFFTVLYLTGMRPQSEAAQLTAEMLDRERKRAILVKHKNRRKTGRPRVIYFSQAAWEIIERLAEKHPTGPLFRNKLNRPLCSRAMEEYLKAACERAGVKRFPAYTLRHYFLSTALGRGVPIEVLAQLCGNSPNIIRQNYAKLGDDVMADVLARAAEQAV